MIDHLVYAVPDLDQGVAAVGEVLGTEPVAGGRHVGRGTRNALVGLGDGYLEIIGPDPDQPPPPQPRPFGIDALAAPQLVAWAVRCRHIEAVVAAASQAGFDFGPIEAMRRATPEGGLLSWRLTSPRAGTRPFLIDWGSTPHPASILPASPLRLVSLRLEAPDDHELRRLLDHLGVAATVAESAAARIEATIEAGSRTVVLA